MTGPIDNPGRALWRDVLPQRQGQLEFDFPGVPSGRANRIRASLREFAFGFAPRLGSRLLMRVGVPVVAATTPMAIEMVAPQHRDNVWVNLGVGSALGGVWGAAVGAMLPFNGVGEKIPRLKSTGLGAASGIVLAPAVAVASKYVVDWLTTPLREELEPSGSTKPAVPPASAEG